MCCVCNLGRAYIPSSINRETNSLMVYVRFEQQQKKQNWVYCMKKRKIIATTVTAVETDKNTDKNILIQRAHRAEHSCELSWTKPSIMFAIESNRCMYEVSESMFISNQLQHIKCIHRTRISICVVLYGVHIHTRSGMVVHTGCLLLVAGICVWTKFILCKQLFFSREKKRKEKEKNVRANEQKRSEREIETETHCYTHVYWAASFGTYYCEREKTHTMPVPVHFIRCNRFECWMLNHIFLSGFSLPPHFCAVLFWIGIVWLWLCLKEMNIFVIIIEYFWIIFFVP